MHKSSTGVLAGLCVGAIAVAAFTVADRAGPAPSAMFGQAVAVPAASTPAAGSAGAGGTENPPDESTVDRLAPGAKVSAIVFDRKAGAQLAAIRPDAEYTSASLVKLLIATEALSSGTPDTTVRRMLSRSDDALASALWTAHGGPAIVTGWAARMGLTGTKPPRDPGRWGDTTITAADVVRVYRYLTDRAAEAVRGVILSGLREATEDGSDGFRQYFGIPDAAQGLPWAVKQGWSCCRPTRMLHTSGLVGADDRYVVAVLTAHPASVTDKTGSRRVTDIVSALHPLLTATR